MTNIQAIIQLVDSYLEKSGRSFVDAPEANAMLARAGLLADSHDRPGMPLRRLLRAGLLPRAYQENGTGTKWFIPHSQSNGKPQASESTAIKTIVRRSRYIGPSDPEQSPSFGTLSMDLAAVLSELARNRFEAASGEGCHLPDRPGVYLICLNKDSRLPRTEIHPHMQRFEGLDVIYAGISDKSLRGRDYGQHFNGTAGRSTLRKSLGVFLGFRLIPRDKDPLTGKTKFNDEDETKLSNWMQANLTMFCVATSDCRRIEEELIRHFNPPFIGSYSTHCQSIFQFG